jgi:16S rRNA processing protein RimM
LGDDVVVGRILGVFGLQGEVKLAAADPHALRPGLEVRLELEGGAEISSVIEAIRPHQRSYVARLRGFADADAARSLRGATVVASRDDLPKLSGDVYREVDLAGMHVVDQKLGNLGDVREIRRYPSCDMLVVGEKKLLVPMLRVYGVKVDTKNRIIHVSLPDGFEELI